MIILKMTIILTYISLTETNRTAIWAMTLSEEQ